MRQLLFFALVVSLAACAGTPDAKVGPTPEKAQVLQLEIRDQNFTDFTAIAHVEFTSPLAVEDATWELFVDNEVRASGTSELKQTLPEEGGVVRIAAKTTYAPQGKLAEVLDREDPLPIRLRGTIRTADGRIFEFTKAGLVRTPRTPDVKVYHVEAGAHYDEKRIGLVFFVRVENRNPFDVTLEQLDYDLSINGKRLIEQGVAGSHERVPPASTAQLEIPLELTEENFPEVKSHLSGSRALDYTLEGIVKLGVGKIPVDLRGPIQLGGS